MSKNSPEFDAGDAAKDVAKKKITDSVAAKAAAGGTKAGGAVGGVVGNIGEAAQAAKNKDVVGAADAAVRGAAAGAASAVLSPAGGAAVSAALDSKAGRKASRFTTRVVIGIIAAVIVIPSFIAVSTLVAVMSSAATIISNTEAVDKAVNEVYKQVCSIALPPLVEPTGTEEEEEAGEDVITPTEAEAINDELRARTYTVAGEGIMSRQEVEDFQDGNCVSVAFGDLDFSGGYVLPPPEGAQTVFTDGGIVFPDTEVALRRALMFVGNAHLACSDGMCLAQCDGLAGEIWGYANSGYASARVHWQHAVDNGYAHPGDTNPPIGALLYWDTNHKYGHVATYVGNGMVVSNLTTRRGVSNVYLMPADTWSGWHRYLGWSEPVFRGAKRSNAGFSR